MSPLIINNSSKLDKKFQRKDYFSEKLYTQFDE